MAPRTWLHVEGNGASIVEATLKSRVVGAYGLLQDLHGRREHYPLATLQLGTTARLERPVPTGGKGTTGGGMTRGEGKRLGG